MDVPISIQRLRPKMLPNTTVSSRIMADKGSRLSIGAG